MYHQQCPTSIVPEVWRRAFAALLDDENVVSLSEAPSSPQCILKTLIQAIKVPVEGEEDPFHSPPNLERALHHDKLARCLTLLQQETCLIQELYEATYAAAQAKSNELQRCIKWAEECISTCPAGALSQQRETFSNLERQLVINRAELSSIARFSRFVAMLEEDAHRYKFYALKHHKIALAIAEDAKKRLLLDYQVAQHIAEAMAA
ncbi:uncharacterized protein RHO25_013173 [Cercospora beticola]|uniref:4Fe-4S ferredoxin-type domain-containing protein n=1 Tax=Cercospora beticola TaxID=122368 RepID=A0ABZ0PA40_CERBT|nr:hypothetical protein RHO25_013173 [Cercospora beticola]CAK1356629.1 unnamed protein product [Cercospora beticola]